MPLKRQFCYIALFGLLTILSIAVLVSIGETLNHRESPPKPSGLAERQSTITFTIPWHGKLEAPAVHEDLAANPGATPIVAGSQPSHTLSAYSAISSTVAAMHSDADLGTYDFFPSTTTASGSSTPIPTSISGTDDAECTDTETNTSTLCASCIIKEIETGIPEMLGYVSPSSSICSDCIPQTTPPSIPMTSSFADALRSNMTVAMPDFITPMGYICRPSLVPTIATLGCEVCTTLTETWHSTVSSCTETMIISITTMTITETRGNHTVLYSPCPSGAGLTLLPEPSAQNAPLSYVFSNSTPSLHNLFPNIRSESLSAAAATTTHPCPNSGYSCSSCPGGWFCPPVQTPATNCPCGWGWACADCVGGWYCVPGPTSTSMSSITTLSRIGTTVTSVTIPASSTVSIITTGVPVAPLILPAPSSTGSDGIERRAWPEEKVLERRFDWENRERGR